VALGGLSMLPPYVGPPLGLGLDVRASVEVVDHVLAGAVVVLCAGLAALFVDRRARAQAPITGLVLYSSAFLAGLFQTATHVPLLLEAGATTPWGAVLHSALAPVITGIALWLTARSLTTAFPEGGGRASGAKARAEVGPAFGVVRAPSRRRAAANSGEPKFAPRFQRRVRTFAVGERRPGRPETLSRAATA
jgi:hypothetical protein